jgi:hypothetical protein
MSDEFGAADVTAILAITIGPLKAAIALAVCRSS